MLNRRLRVEKVNENLYKIYCLKVPAHFEVFRNEKGFVGNLGFTPEYGPPGFESPYLHDPGELDDIEYGWAKAREIEQLLRADNQRELRRLKKYY